MLQTLNRLPTKEVFFVFVCACACLLFKVLRSWADEAEDRRGCLFVWTTELWVRTCVQEDVPPESARRLLLCWARVVNRVRTDPQGGWTLQKRGLRPPQQLSSEVVERQLSSISVDVRTCQGLLVHPCLLCPGSAGLFCCRRCRQHPEVSAAARTPGHASVPEPEHGRVAACPWSSLSVSTFSISDVN